MFYHYLGDVIRARQRIQLHEREAERKELKDMFPEAIYRITAEDRAAERAEIALLRQMRLKRRAKSLNFDPKERQLLVRPLFRFMAWLRVAVIGAFLVGCTVMNHLRRRST